LAKYFVACGEVSPSVSLSPSVNELSPSVIFWGFSPSVSGVSPSVIFFDEKFI